MAQQDHYRALGVRRSASKEEIKTAYRKSALEHHPDRHAQSSAAVRESAAAKFRRASEAYETLIDERRRSDYDLRLRTGATGTSTGSYGGYGGGRGTYSRTSNPGSSSSGSYASGHSRTWTSSGGSSSASGYSWSWSWSWSWSSGPTGAGGRGSGSGGGGGGGAGTNGGYHYAGDGSGRSETGWQFLSRVMTTRRFLIGVGCVSVLVGSTLLIENAIERAWKRNNSGKSFEEALEALEKARIEKDRGY